MTWTKREIISQAFIELGVTDYQHDLDAAQIVSALRELDTMVAEWDMDWSYPLPDTPDASDIDADSLIPWASTQAVYLNLALRIAPDIGKDPMRQTALDAARGKTRVFAGKLKSSALASSPDTAMLPLGAGHKNLDRVNVVEGE